MTLRESLLAIYEAHGKLTPELVVSEAEDPDSPLHPRFIWDDAACGARYRESQAVDLIQSVQIAFVNANGESRKVREFWAVERNGQYVPMAAVQDDDMTVQIMLRQAEREWTDLKARYGHLAEFVAMIREQVA